MTTPDLVIVVPLYTGAIVLIIREIADAFRRQRREAAATVAHDELVKKSDQVVDIVTEVKEKANGATDKFQQIIADQSVEIGRLQGMVQGLQTMRRGGRSSDLPPPPITEGDRP